MATCERCYKKTLATTMSYFNTQMICLDCEKLEREHKEFKRAQEAEEAQVRVGNFNYGGIGKPADL